MEQYSIWLNKSWVPIEKSMALEKLGGRGAQFNPRDVMFFSIHTFEGGLAGAHQFAKFTVSDAGDSLYALQSSVIKCDYDAPYFEYFINPSDFLDTERTRVIEKSLGNPDAFLIGA